MSVALSVFERYAALEGHILSIHTYISTSLSYLLCLSFIEIITWQLYQIYIFCVLPLKLDDDFNFPLHPF